MQETLGSVFEPPSPSLYSAVYGEGLIVAPSFGEWLLYGLDAALVIPAIITSLVGLSAKTYNKGAVRAAFAGFLTISTADLIIFFFDGERVNIGQAIPFNALGAVFVWLFFTILFMIFECCKSKFLDFAPTKISYPLLSIVSAGTVSLVVFFLFQIFFNPSPSVKFQAIADIPTSGFMVSDNRKTDDDGSKRRPLSAFPENSLASYFDITGYREGFEAIWKKSDPNSKFSLRVSLYSDCPYPTDLSKLPSGEALIEAYPKDFMATMSSGQTRLVTAHDGTRQYNLRMANISQYWFKANEAGNIDSIEAFIDKEDTVEVNPERGLKFFVSGPLSKVKGNSSIAAKRRMTLKIDGDNYEIDAGGSRMISGKKLNCSSIKGAKITSENGISKISIPGGESLFSLGALVEIIEDSVPLDVYHIERSRLSISNANGWAEIHELDLERTTDSNLGFGRGISIWKNLKRLTIDGKVVEVSKTDKLLAVANLRASFEPNYLEVDGTATALWLNNRRINPTTWERLAEGWQIAIATAILGLLGLFAGKVSPLVLDFFHRDLRLTLRPCGRGAD